MGESKHEKSPADKVMRVGCALGATFDEDGIDVFTPFHPNDPYVVILPPNPVLPPNPILLPNPVIVTPGL
jgi:hypothetical protein